MPDLRIAADLDSHRVAYAERGWAQIDGFLAEDSAALLERHLRSREDWRLHLNQGEKLFELDRQTQQAMPDEKQRLLDAAVYRNAAEEFQFRFEGIRVPDDRKSLGYTPLDRFSRLLNSDSVLDRLRRLTGASDIDFADAQATLYSAGHFLTTHDDDVAGKGRRAAYVYSLNPRWRVDWGGLLHMLDGSGPATALIPGWNRLSIFRVPQPHSVSMVTPAAPMARLSITGWLRTR